MQIEMDSQCENAGLERWYLTAMQAATRACNTYHIRPIWARPIADCSVGIIAVESKFGRSRRYLAKRTLEWLSLRSALVASFRPSARGIAQIDRYREQYLTNDAGLVAGLDVGSRCGAIQATALGLAKAASIHFPILASAPSAEELAIIAITHNAGWMAPRVARLQEVLAKLNLLPADTPRTGFVGPLTLVALDLAAARVGCVTLAEFIRAEGLATDVACGLTDPDLESMIRGSELFASLGVAAGDVGECLTEPKFPDYCTQLWHTGRIASRGYANAVLSYSDGRRNKSITNLGAASNSDVQ